MKKNILTAGVAVLILGLSLVAVLIATGAPSAPSPAPDADLKKPVTLILQDVSSVSFTPAKGMAFTLALSDGGDAAVSISPTRPGFDYDGDLLLETVTAAVALDGCRLLAADDGGDPALYGFDSPLIAWDIQTVDGEHYALEMGAQSGGGDGVYLRMDGDPGVYILPLSSAARFARSEAELRRLRFLPDYGSEQEAMRALQYFGVEGRNTPFVIRLMSQEEVEEAPLVTAYQFLEPTVWYCENHDVVTELVLPVLTLGFQAVVEDDPADLSLYGLDTPHRLELKDDRGWQAALLIGGEGPEGGRYVMQEGLPTVFWDQRGDYSFLNINHTKLLNRLFWVYDLKTVSRVDYDFDGMRHILHYDVTDDAFSGAIDGRPLSETNGRRLYIHTLQLTLNDSLPENAVVGPRFGAITITLRDGTSHTFALYPVGDRSYNVHFDGADLRLTVHKDTVERVLRSLATVVGGGTIEEL